MISRRSSVLVLPVSFTASTALNEYEGGLSLKHILLTSLRCIIWSEIRERRGDMTKVQPAVIIAGSWLWVLSDR